MQRSRLSLPITAEEKMMLRGYGVQVACPKRTILFASGDPADRIYLIEEGWVNIYRLTSEGQRITVGLRCCGELFGITGILYGGERTAYAETLTDCVLLQLAEDELDEIGRENPLFYPRMAEIMAQRVVEAEEIICDLTSQQVPQRLAHLLLRMAKRYGHSNTDGVTLNIRLTHEDLADMIGTSRPTVTTTLKAFRKANTIRLDGRGIQIYPERLANWVS